jgi:hypothetical protein
MKPKLEDIRWQAWGKEDIRTPGFSIDIRLIRSDDMLAPKKSAFRLPWLDPPPDWSPTFYKENE